MAVNEKAAGLPGDVSDFLGMGKMEAGGAGGGAFRPPSFGGVREDEDWETDHESVRRPDQDTFSDRTGEERRARFKASARMLFSTDVSKLGDEGASALYQCVTEGMFGLQDEDGTVAFGRRASKDPRQNIEMLRKFVRGDYSLIEDPEYTEWRQMDEEAKFRYALEHEKTSNKVKSYMKGERGAGFWENLRGGAGMSVAGLPAGLSAFQPESIREQNREIAAESARRSDYETLTDEEKAKYRADVVGDYEERLSRRQTLATFLQFANGLSDRASYVLAKSFNEGRVDAAAVNDIADEDERGRVYAAFSLMRGDRKKGRILGIETDFTDGTRLNRLQLMLYGFQQSVVGLVADTGAMARDAAVWTYAKCAMDEQERRDFFKGWDAVARAERAMEQGLPEAEGFFGEMFQGLAENAHWFIPYWMIGKGGRMVTAARGIKGEQGFFKGLVTTLRPMRLGGGLKRQKATLEAGRAAMGGAAEAKALAAADSLAFADPELLAGGARALDLPLLRSLAAREVAAVDRYTQMLRGIDADLKAAKWWKDAAGTAMWAAGEASAFSAFASEYVAAADAAGVSREESVLTAAAIGLINAKIEQLYVPGLESSLAPAQVKSLTLAAMAQAVRTDGAAGFRKWLANRVSKGVTEGLKVAASEGLVEEPLQQMAVEHGKAFDRLCQGLRENGQAALADEAKALWRSFAATLPDDYATFIDTAVDMLPSSAGFGVTTVGNQTRRQHVHNALTRHANRRAGATSTMMTAQTMDELRGASDYDAGLVDVIQRAVDVQAAVERHWNEAGGADGNPHRFEEAVTAARRAWRDPQTGDAVREIADAAGVDVKTAEVLAQYFQAEAEAAAFSPQARAWTSLNMSLADIDEATIRTVLPGYVEGSFASDPENGVYSARVKMGDGTEKTVAYRVGDFSAELMAEAENMAKADSSFGKSFDARHAELGDGVTWASLSDAQRYAEAARAQANVNGFSTGRGGVFELTDAKGGKVRVNADDVIYLANGRIGDIGYGPAATQATVRHETFHSLWRFVRATLDDADVQRLAKTLGIDVTKDGWEVDLDEKMAHEMERYASGHYVSHAVSSRFDRMLDSWAGKLIDFFGKFGPSDEVTDPRTGKPYRLKGLYDSILRGELGSGALGVELRKVESGGVNSPTPNSPTQNSSKMPVEVTDADRAAHEAQAQAEVEAQAQEEAAKEETPAPAAPASPAPAATASTAPAADAENPADASTPDQRYYRVGLPNSPVKLVGRLEVRDVDTGVTTSTDADYHDRGNQNRDDRSEESRSLVLKIGANPDPLQIGTVQPVANNGIVWILPNGDVIIGNHRVNGVRLGYEKGTAGELEKFVREDAAKRGIEIGADVKKPLTVFVLERIESPDGKADVHEVVRLANESQNRGFNVREQASNDAKILVGNNLLPQMAFRADGRIDEAKSGDAIGVFRRETGAQGMVAGDGSLTEEGQTRIRNAALAALLGAAGDDALLNKIMANAGRLDMQGELRALMKMTPELMALAEAKPGYDLRAPLAEALRLFTEWRDRDEEARAEKGRTRRDWRETAKDGTRRRGISWETFMSQGDMFRRPSKEAVILGDLFAKAESLRSFDREDVESEAGKKRVVDLVSGYLADYVRNARAVNTETEDMFGGTPATRGEVLAAQRATGGENGARFSIDNDQYSTVPERLNESLQRISFDNETAADIAALRKVAERNIKAGADDTPSESEARSLKRRINEENAKARARKKLADETSFPDLRTRYLNDEQYYRESAKELREQLKELERNGIGEDRDEVDWYTNGDLLEILDSIESGEASASMHFDPYAIGPEEGGPFAEALKNLADSGNFKGKDLERLNRLAKKINDAYKEIERDIEDPRGPFGESLRYSISTEGLSDTEKKNLRAARTEAQRVLARVGGTEIGRYINAEFRREGRATLIGKRVASARDLAALAQIYRNPCFETFRYFFTKGGEIVWQTGVTARLPGVTNTSVNTPKEDTYAEIGRMAAKLEPDGVWLLHNHPSGHVAPSKQDISTTNRLRTYFDSLGVRLGGHVIIDHDAYAELDEKGNYTLRKISADKLEASYHGDPYTNRLRERGEPFNFGTVAAYAMNLQRGVSQPGKVLTLISLDNKAEFVTAVANIPAESVADGDDIGSRFKQLDGFFADWRSASGGGNLFFVGDQDVRKYPASVQRVLRRQIEIGNATDFLFSDSGNWDSVVKRGEVKPHSIEADRLITSRTETFDDGQQRYSIAGRAGAANLGIGKLDEAEDMEKAGRDREEIWRATGWWRGTDGKWRVELPGVSKVKAPRLQPMRNPRTGGPETGGSLSDFIENDALFAAYPSLKGLPVYVDEELPVDGITTIRRLKGEQGRYEPAFIQLKAGAGQGEQRGGDYTLNLSEKDLRTLRHEVEHAIQATEGHSFGAYSGDSEADWVNAGEVEARNAARRETMTPGERAATPPWETEDVLADRQTVRFSVAKELVDAMREREAMQPVPVEGAVQPWPENFPKVMLQTTLASVKRKWPELHAKAKAGDREAALELVRNILGEEPSDGRRNPKWEKLRSLAAAHPDAIVSHVHAEEATGRNAIPAAYAAMIELITGLRVEQDIVQSVKANHTGANAVERMTRRAAFDGPVQGGAEYILVDDHVTQGGTLNELRKYIQSHGGKIVAITTLTASQFSDTISITQDAIEALHGKFGNNLDEELKEAGIANGVAELTQSQARELRKLRADTLRDRLAEARQARLSELDARTARYSIDGGTRLADSQRLVADDKSGCAADGKLHTGGLDGLSGEAARERMYEQAEANAPALKAVVEAAAKAVGGGAVHRRTLKKRERVDEKAKSDYKGDYSRVVDLIGGTVVLDPSQDMTDALTAIRENLPKDASIAQVKKLSSPDAGGYWDVKVSVRFANGGIGEIILVDRYVNEAKFNRGGHDLYDYARELEPLRETDPDADRLWKDLKKLELAIYSHNTPKAAEYQATWDLAKASASASLTRLQGNGNASISSAFIGSLKELLSGSHLQRPASLDSYATPARSFIQNISDSSLTGEATGDSLPDSGASVNGEFGEQRKRFSTEAPRRSPLYPPLAGMSDDELVAAAVAAKMALGQNGGFSEKAVKDGTVRDMLSRLHPDWGMEKLAVEARRVLIDAKKLGKRIRADLDRGVSESLVLRHLPDTAREQFGREMIREAGRGRSLGEFGQRAESAVAERQEKVVADAVRVQTGLDAASIENAFGINLSETIMRLSSNPFTEEKEDGKEESGGEETPEEDAAGGAPDRTGGEGDSPAEIDAKVKAAVDDIAFAARAQAEIDEANRLHRREEAARDAENEAAMDGDGEEAPGTPASADAPGGDALAAAAKKSALDLENPRHLARFVAELARRRWIEEHGLAPGADVWRDLVAVQFLRKTAQSVYSKLVRDLTYSRGRETAVSRIARLDNVPTFAGLLSEMEFLGALINANRIRETQKELCSQLEKFLKREFGARGRFSPDREEGRRKVSAEAELRARYMRECMWFTPEKAEEEARRLQETLDALSVDFADAGRDADQSREFVETIRKLNVLREFGALRYKPVGEIETAFQWWRDFARGESDDIVREMSDRDIRTEKAAHLLAAAFADPKRETIREGGRADALNRFITGHMGFISLLQDCMRHASDADAAAAKDIIDYISREVQKAGDRSEAEKRRHNDAFHAAVESIYGKSFNAVMKDMMAPDERFARYMGVVGGKRVTPTKGRALQLLVSLLQEGRKIEVEDGDDPGKTKTVWVGGYHDNIVKHGREGQADEIMRLLDTADMNMLKWLGQWYEDNRSGLSEVCRSLFGIGVYAELPNYFPVKMMRETHGLEKGQGVGWTIFPKALTPRVRNRRDFDTTVDIFSMWASRMEEAAQWKHHARLGLEMRGIFGRAELRETVRANHGASVDELMQGFITDILAGHGAYDRSTAGVQYFSDQIRGWTALCALGGNVGVTAKQTTSMPAFGFEIGLVNTAKYMVSAFTPEGMAAMGRIWDSEQRQTRWQVGSSETVRNALNRQNAGWLKRALQASMVTNKIGDVIPVLVVGQGIYRDCLARGMSEDDAMSETWSIIERTQQSGRMENQTSIQRRNKLGRIMFQFLSTQQQYLQYEMRAIREVIARPDSVKRWGNLGRAILLNHFILSSAYFWMGELYKACLGQEPPEDELKDWLITCLLGPYGSLFVAGFCCKYTLERAIKGYSIRGGSSMLPMESWLKNQVNDGAKLLEAVFDSDGDTWDNMLEAAGRWMSDSNSVVRDLRKLYRYRIKGEGQKK